jgi:hypothetical protein
MGNHTHPANPYRIVLMPTVVDRIFVLDNSDTGEAR